MLKKILKFTILFMACQHLAFAMQHTQKQMKMVNKKKNYTITMAYPVIVDTRRAEFINDDITQALAKFQKDFLSNLPENKKLPELPLNSDSNALDISYDLYQNPYHVLSLRFTIYQFYYGTAHPSTYFYSMNFSEDEGDLVKLYSLFHTPNLLGILSHYTKRVLTKKLSADAHEPVELDAKGLQATEENFSVWNMDSDGLRLTFPAYQLAAYVFGPQEVVVPYDLIK